MSAGAGLIMLASSHAFTSRMTSESGLGGRGGGLLRGRANGGSRAAGKATGLLAVPVEGAVLGRFSDICRLISTLSSLSFPCLEAGLRRCRASQFFVVSGLPPWASFCSTGVFLVFFAVMLTAARGVACVDKVRCVMSGVRGCCRRSKGWAWWEMLTHEPIFSRQVKARVK